MVDAENIRCTVDIHFDCGYLAFGFNHEMANNDMWAMRHDLSQKERTGFVSDIKASGHDVKVDDEQNYDLKSLTFGEIVSEDGGDTIEYATFVVERKVDTGDSDDEVIVFVSLATSPFCRTRR